MSRLTLPPVLCVVALLGTTVAQAVVSITDLTWTGKGGDSTATNANNWNNNTAPTFSGGSENLEKLIFPDKRPGNISFSANSDLYGLTVTGHYHFTGAIFLHLYGGGLTYSTTNQNHLVFENSMAIDLAANQTWSIGTNGRVEFYSSAYLTGSGKMTKTGAGTLDPYAGNGSWTGGLQFDEGTIVLRPSNYGTTEDQSRSLGTGTVMIGVDTANRPTFRVQGDNDNDVNLANAFELNGVFASRNERELTLLGAVTLNADTTFRTAGSATFIEGAVSESGGARKVTVDSAGALILSGTSGWTGGTDVTKGILIFGGETPNLPSGTANILVGTSGYAGISNDNSISSFMGKINTASTGTIGFDSDPEGTAPEIFNPETTIDLSGFNASLRLGSASWAKLGSAVTITPNGSNYRFGGGGGWLQVDPLLTSGRTLTLDSPSDLPLTARFTNTGNAFTSVSVTNSAAVFAPGALPSGATLTVNNGAYLGTEDTAVTASLSALDNYLARFGAGTQGIIGFDIDQLATSPTTRVVDLTDVSIGSLTSTGYLGTTSALFTNGEVTGPGVRFTGAIAASADGKHRFAAYKTGALEVSGTLTGSELIIGHPSALGAFGDRIREEYSTVMVTGNNANKLANGTTFYGGRLVVGQATGDGTIGTDHTHALGEGTLKVEPVSFSLEMEDGAETPTPMLMAASDNIIISNPIAINASELNVGGDKDFKLTGVISGTGELYVGEDSDTGFVLTLTGANTYSGGTYVTNDALLKAYGDSALGTGKLAFGNSASRVEFNTTAPVIYGLESNTSSAKVELISTASPQLRIIQNSDTTYMGELRADSGTTGNMGLFVKEGTGTLRLNDVDIYGYGQGANQEILEVKAGTLVLADVSFETTNVKIKVNGGTLALDNNESISNSINLVSGKIAGNGTFDSSLTIGSGATLSPGFANGGNIGKLTIDHLELNSGGILEWHIQNPATTGGAGIRDIIEVGVDQLAQTLVINAHDESLSSKFTLKIISLDLSGVTGGQLTDIDPAHGLYTWTLISFDSLSVPGNDNVFDASAFALDTSLFSANGLTGDAAGTFSVFQSASSNQIMLGFTPVPEPSTYALILVGLGLIALHVKRSRNG